MIASRYFVWFVLYSIAGWLYEAIFLSIKRHKWENKGFLFGPWCPIYGIGAVIMSAMVELMESLGFTDYTWWQIFLIAFLGSIVLEYTTAWGLEKAFHACWWDYSKIPFNIQGKVCLPASLGFGIAGILLVYYVYPFMCRWTAHVPMEIMEFVSLIMMAVLSADLTLTVVSLRNFDRTVNAYTDMLNQHMETWIASVGAKLQSVELRIAEERERFSRESLEHISITTNGFFLSAIRRVTHFQNNGDEKKREQFDRVFQAVINRVKFKKKP